MPKAFIVDTQVDDNGRRRVQAILQFAREESLNPRDVGLQTIDSIVLSPQHINRTEQAVPIGSVGAKVGAAFGSPGPEGHVSGQGPGSTITLRWAIGSSGTRIADAHGLGTAALGTKTAHAWLHGT